MGLTPLHSTIYGYHVSRVNETCELIDELLNAGANAQIVNKVSCNNFQSSNLSNMYYCCVNILLFYTPIFIKQSGETAAHLAVNTDDLQVVSKFIEYLGPEVLNYCDSSGNTLFHYAVGCLDEDSIYKVRYPESFYHAVEINNCQIK